MQEIRQKIAFLLPSLGGGGAERVVVNLVNELCNNENIIVDLVLGQAQGEYVDLVNKNVNIVDLKSPRMGKSLFKLVNYLKINKPSILISGLDYVNVIALIARQLAGVNTSILITEHNTLSQIVQNSKSLKTTLLVQAMKLFYKKADKVIAVSKGVATDLCDILGLNKESVQVIYNPVINKKILELSNKTINHKWINEKTAPVILAIGRLTPQKDFSTLIDSFGILRKERNAKLIILGEGELRSSLQNKVNELGLSEDIDLYGFHNNPYAFIRNSDVFVLSSKWEGLPTVLIEALACGGTVVSTDCKSGPEEILNKGKFGKLVPVGDSSELALQIQKTLRDKNPVDTHKLENWLNQFQSEEVTNNYKALIQEFI